MDIRRNGNTWEVTDPRTGSTHRFETQSAARWRAEQIEKAIRTVNLEYAALRRERRES